MNDFVIHLFAQAWKLEVISETTFSYFQVIGGTH
jgi:hypothetical protein